MKIGLIVAPYEGALAGERTPRWPDLRELAVAAEANGYASIWLPDHQLIRMGDGPAYGTWDAQMTMAAIATVTATIELGFFVLCASFRNPALTAKMAVTLDEISDGRLILGLGAGWHEPEYTAYGFPFDHRGDRFEEALQIIRPLVRNGQVDFRGTYHEAIDCELLPRGPRPHGPPILIGTSAPKRTQRAHRLTARYADWHNDWMRQPEQVATRFEAVDEACRAEGRDPSTLVRTGGIVVLETPGGETGERAPAQIPLADTETWIEVLRGYEAAGVEHVQAGLEPMSIEAIERFAPVVAALAG